MTANPPAAYGMYPHDASLNDIVRSFNSAGFRNEDICMMLSPHHPMATMVRDARISDGHEANAANAVLIAWFSELGAVVIPTVGFFIRSQAFFHALLADDSPALCGRGPRTLLGLGLPQCDAEHYENCLDAVGALFYVSCPEMKDTLCAVELLRQTGAQDVSSSRSPSFGMDAFVTVAAPNAGSGMTMSAVA